jgi:chromosome segregation ATPase
MSAPDQKAPSSRKNETQGIFDRILDIIENLELENLANLLRVSELEEKITRLRGEKIALDREVERLTHKLEQAEKSHEQLARVIAEATEHNTAH